VDGETIYYVENSKCVTDFKTLIQIGGSETLLNAYIFQTQILSLFWSTLAY